MALFEPDHRAYEAKTQPFDLPDQLDINAHEYVHCYLFSPCHVCIDDRRTPLSNGHHDLCLTSPTSLNTSAHDTNSNLNTHHTEPPLSNGTVNKEDHIHDTQISLEPSSSLPDSGDTGDRQFPPSSQSALEDSYDHSAMAVDTTSFNSLPAVVQQPTSDLREETKPETMEQTAEIMEQKAQQEMLSQLNADGTEIDATGPVATAREPESEPLAEPEMPPTPPKETQADPTEPSAPVGSQPPNVSDATELELPEKPVIIPAAAVPNHQLAPVPDGTVAEALIDPAPSPGAPAEIAAMRATESFQVDQFMQDAPPSPTKVARGREDDDMADGPAAKRSKTDEDAASASEFKVPELPAINTQVNTQVNGDQPEETAKTATPITKAQQGVITRIMTNVKRIQASAAFRTPVDFVSLNILNYPNVVKNPMDLKTLDDNLKAHKYPTVDAWVADFNLIVDNCRLFNGSEHDITKKASEMKANFDRQMEKMPGPDVTAPSPADKKKKSTVPPTTKISQPRRESRSSLPGTARSPVSASSPQTFALGPQGVPLIRRDSTFGDGRPKREIHPPAPRDLPYSNQKPKKKKFLWELKFCDHVLKELEKPKYNHWSYFFMAPVDPVALNIPTYHSIIKKPMDFGTVRQKLDRGEYENAKEFEADVRLIFQNCYKFNRAGDNVSIAGHAFEDQFDFEWAKKRDWIEANTPASGAQTPGSSDVEDSADEDQEEEAEEVEDQLSALQKQIAEINRQVEAITHKKKSPPVSNKKASKIAKPARKDSKKYATPAKIEKKVSAKPAKKEKTPYISYEQKQDISNRINSLNEKQMANALKIIRDHMPTLQVRPKFCKKLFLYFTNAAILEHELDTDLFQTQGIQDDELELDIDELSDEVLHRLLQFVRKATQHRDESPARPAPATSSAAPARKKNKPMSKHEQEARIAQVQNGLSAFQNPGSVPSCKSCLHQVLVGKAS